MQEAETAFERLWTHDNKSLVSCEPKTGRTHQIRLHLQSLGFPILNDPLYNGDREFDMSGAEGRYSSEGHGSRVERSGVDGRDVYGADYHDGCPGLLPPNRRLHQHVARPAARPLPLLACAILQVR